MPGASHVRGEGNFGWLCSCYITARRPERVLMAGRRADDVARADAVADGTRRNDPCWESARTMLKPGGLQAIEDEAREWRRTLTESLEQYHNEQQRAYYALHPGASYAVYRRWRADFHPRPPNTNNNTRDLDVMSTNSQEAYTRRRFDFFLPRRVAERTRGLCRRPLLLGGRSSFRTSVDGFVACGMDAMVADGQQRSGDDGSCIVYSLGSNNIFEFEAPGNIYSKLRKPTIPSW